MATPFTSHTIETLPQWNAVLANGCCCEMPVCPTPQRVCQSITVDSSCAILLPALSIVPEEERCHKYFRKEYYHEDTLHQEITNGSEFSYYDRSIKTTNTFTLDPEDECASLRFSLYEDHTTQYHQPSGGGPRDIDFTDFYDSSSSPTVPCSGTHVYTDNVDSGNNITEAYDVCPTTAIEPDNTWTYAAGVFELDGSYDVDADTRQTLITRLTFTEKMDAAWFTARLDDLTFPDDANGESCVSSITLDPDCPDIPLDATKARYRWAIPDTFEGSYFLVTWDVLEEPTGWDATINDPGATPPDPLPEGVTLDEWWADHQVPDPDAPDRSFVSEDLTWEWTGPGDPEDPDSWKSSWYDIPPPSVPGERRVVNIRFICYRSPYGQKPQVTGEAVTLPDFT